MSKKKFKNIEVVDEKISSFSGPVALGAIIFLVLVIVIVLVVAIFSNKREEVDLPLESTGTIFISGNDVTSQFWESGINISISEEYNDSALFTDDDVTMPELSTSSGAVFINHDFLNNEDYPKITELIKNYFSAYESCNTSALMMLVDYNGGMPVTNEELEQRSEVIEKYNNIECYIIEGMESGTFVVYVYYDIKFYNIDTSAPTLTRFYVVEDSTDSVRIYNGEITAKLSAYLNTVNDYDCVKLLSDDVDKKLEEACNNDERLEELMKILYEE